VTEPVFRPLDGMPGCETDDHCITCGDMGTPMRVVEIDRESGLALCEDETGRRATVEIALVVPVLPDDRLLVHAGTGLTNLGPEEAVAK
jgi:hydrogenase maturation factor